MVDAGYVILLKSQTYKTGVPLGKNLTKLNKGNIMNTVEFYTDQLDEAVSDRWEAIEEGDEIAYINLLAIAEGIIEEASLELSEDEVEEIEAYKEDLFSELPCISE